MTNLDKAISILPEHYRKVLELRFDKKFTIHETAEYMNLEMVAVRNLQYRALKELNQVLAELHRANAISKKYS
ncbi:TPA: hypothetical protein DIC39_02540 [Patescibacteria group bacterium]|nr:MAG: hypothetical protein UX54_C0009G0002 [Parcubacteria group bacterium GW2011_GWA2_46_39]HBV33019.1 hypothetical protein [Patescibacteria group bacterium]HCU47911.1 hypothetical protein [Patescibacteria group bacterium]